MNNVLKIFLALVAGAILLQGFVDDGITGAVAVIPGILLLLAFGIAYFAPALIAYHRKLSNATAILVVNILFGWTLLGWGGSLAWSLLGTAKKDD